MMALVETLPIETSHDIYADLVNQYYCRIRANELHLTPELAAAWEQLQAQYPHMPADEFTPGSTVYRFRRYDSFRFDPTTGELRILPHRDYFQGKDINTVTGGIVRKFSPLTAKIANNPFLQALIRFDFAQFPLDDEMRTGPWQVDVHMIRVIASGNHAGHPTPEGIHRDGAAYVTVHLAELENADGGEVSVYDDGRNLLKSFTLEDVMDAYLFNDAVLWHGVTPIVPVHPHQKAVRSILTFDYHYKPDLA